MNIGETLEQANNLVGKDIKKERCTRYLKCDVLFRAYESKEISPGRSVEYSNLVCEQFPEVCKFNGVGN
jgi:hypothetical protein